MAQFKASYEITAIFEGGYSNVADDNGNWTGGVKGGGILVGTNYGISAPDLMHYLGRTPTVADMKNLSLDVAESIYRKNYWNQIRGDEILDQDAANAIYDSAVNMGVKTAIILVQRDLGMEETGIMTTSTLNKLNNKS